MTRINNRAFAIARDIAIDCKANLKMGDHGNTMMLRTFLESYLTACEQEETQQAPVSLEAEAMELIADGICERWEYGSRDYALSLARRGLMKMMKKFKLVAR